MEKVLPTINLYCPLCLILTALCKFILSSNPKKMAATEAVPTAFGKYKLNYQVERKDPREKVFRATPYFRRDVKLPDRVDLRDKLENPMDHVLDQGEHGTCVANTMASCVNFVITGQSKDQDAANDVPLSFRPSRMFIYWYARQKGKLPADEDTGVGIRDAFHAVSDHSVCREEVWPYDGEHIFREPSSEAVKDAEAHPHFVSIRLSQDAYALKLCLFQGYPIAVGLQLYDSFLSDEVSKTGNVPMPDVEKESLVGGHCVTIIGYENGSPNTVADDVFLILNSWGKAWGDNGICRIPVNYLLHPALADDFHSLREFW